MKCILPFFRFSSHLKHIKIHTYEINLKHTPPIKIHTYEINLKHTPHKIHIYEINLKHTQDLLDEAAGLHVFE